MAKKRNLKATATDKIAKFVDKGGPMIDLGEKSGPEPKATTITGSVNREDLENFNTRLIRGLHMEMSIYCVRNRIRKQDFVNEAIKEKLEASK